MKIKFPEYNPLPVRRERLNKEQKEIANRLKKKEVLRSKSANKHFSSWENKDRYSYRKNS